MMLIATYILMNERCWFEIVLQQSLLIGRREWILWWSSLGNGT